LLIYLYKSERVWIECSYSILRFFVSRYVGFLFVQFLKTGKPKVNSFGNFPVKVQLMYVIFVCVAKGNNQYKSLPSSCKVTILRSLADCWIILPC